MAHDLEALLERVTPDDADPVDLDALHRRGVRRRWVSRVAAGTAGVAAAAAIGMLGSSLGMAPMVEVDPVAPGAADPTVAETTVPAEDAGPPGGLAFAPSAQDIAEAAATLPEPGDAPDPDDWATLVAQEPGGQLPWLRAGEVSCLYADGDGPTVDAPDGARSDRAWADTAASQDDLAAACLDSDAVRSGEHHAPGPFRVCQGTPAPALRQEMLAGRASGTALAPDDTLPPVTFPAVLTYDADCIDAGEASRLPIDVVAPEDTDALVAQFNDRRRVEAAIRARGAAECLSPTDALALAEAVVARFGQDWWVLSQLDPSGARTGPCVTLTMEPQWGTLVLWPSSATQPPEIQDVAAPSDPTTRDELAELLRDGDPTGASAMLEAVRPRLQDRTEAEVVEALAADGAAAQQVAELVQATGCLERATAITLAWAVHDVLGQQAPERDWDIGQVPGPDAACFQVQLAVHPTGPDAPTETVASSADETLEPEPTPAIRVQPVWTD